MNDHLHEILAKAFQCSQTLVTRQELEAGSSECKVNAHIVAGIWIVAGDGSVSASVSNATPLDAACMEAASRADVAGRSGDVHLHGAQPVVPIAAAIMAKAPRPSAALIVFTAAPLFAILARRPSQPATLESYLVRSRGGRLEFLSPLLFGPPKVAAYDDPRLGARAAAEGRDSFSEGLDYRESAEDRVLTVTRAIPGTDWGLAVEIDVSEALAVLGERQRSRRVLGIAIWIGILGVAYGLARAQRAALAIQSANVSARYIALVDQANDALVVLDETGRVVEANRRTSELYKRIREEILDMNARDFLPPAARRETDRRLARVLADGAGIFEATHVRSDGSTFEVEVSGRVVEGADGERRVVVVSRDISARKADAARIHRLNRLLRTLSSVNELLVRGPEEGHLFDEVCRISVERAEFLVAWIGLADRATGKVRVAARAGAAEDSLDGVEIRWDAGPSAEGPTGTAIREERTVTVSHAEPEDHAPTRAQALPRGIRSSAATPIRRGGEIVGALTLHSAEPDAFDEEIVGLLGEMAADIGYALTTLDNRRRRLEADEKARETEARFRTVLENLPLLVAAFDDDGKIVFWNRGAEEITGLGPEVIGEPPPFERLYPDPARRARALEVWSPSDGDLVDRETTIQAFDGSEHAIVWSTLTRLVNVPGWAAWGIAIDVTKIRRAEEEARRVRVAIEQVTDSVLIADSAGTIVYANPAASHILGYEQHEIVGGKTRDWKADPEARAIDDEMWRTVQAGDTWRGTVVNRTKAGEIVHLSSVVGPIRDAAGKIEGFIGVSRDITHERALLAAKEAAELASHASEGRFRALFENAPIGIGVSRDGETLYVNDACARMLGYDRNKDLIGYPVTNFWSSEIREQLDRRKRALDGGLDISSHYEAEAVRRDGSRFRAEVDVIPMDLPDGPAVVGFMSDVTERRRAEAALRESEQRFRLLSENAPTGIYIRQNNVITYR